VQDLKISLITVAYNAESAISCCIESVIAQNFKNIEYIVIDGGSTDKTLNIINRYKPHISLIVSEPDHGIYDAINKGIKLASGDVIGLLNADDFFSDSEVLSSLALAFSQHADIEIVYGDLDYVDAKGSIIRKWRSGEYRHGMFNRGWMPPHPTFYCKRALFEQFGYYSLNYGTAADYELMLRFMHLNRVKAFYLKKVIIKMKTGGASNKNVTNRVKGLFFDWRAMRTNNILLPFITIVVKPLRKIFQYF
jgi:glycosyltransferase involved in cell wall biosynthesis